MNKTSLAVSLLAATLFAGYSYAEATKNTCGYDPVTGDYVSSDGSVSAYGTFENALACAEKGLLPKVVSDRLGIFGDTSTKRKAAEAVKLNLQIQKEKESKKND